MHQHPPPWRAIVCTRRAPSSRRGAPTRFAPRHSARALRPSRHIHREQSRHSLRRSRVWIAPRTGGGRFSRTIRARPRRPNSTRPIQVHLSPSGGTCAFASGRPRRARRNIFLHDTLRTHDRRTRWIDRSSAARPLVAVIDVLPRGLRARNSFRSVTSTASNRDWTPNETS